MAEYKMYDKVKFKFHGKIWDTIFVLESSSTEAVIEVPSDFPTSYCWPNDLVSIPKTYNPSLGNRYRFQKMEALMPEIKVGDHITILKEGCFISGLSDNPALRPIQGGYYKVIGTDITTAQDWSFKLESGIVIGGTGSWNGYIKKNTYNNSVAPATPKPEPKYKSGQKVRISGEKSNSYGYLSSKGSYDKIRDLNSKEFKITVSNWNEKRSEWYYKYTNTEASIAEHALSLVEDEKKYKENDWVTCLGGFTTTNASGGAGYVAGRTFQVSYTTNATRTDELILWPKPNGCGVYARAVRKATDAEINIAEGKVPPTPTPFTPKFKVGDKVKIPKTKSYNPHKGRPETCGAVISAKYRGQDYLYVGSIRGNVYMIGINEGDKDSTFAESDLELYVEPTNISSSLDEITEYEGYKVGDWITITRKPELWAESAGGESPLGSYVGYPLVVQIEKFKAYKVNDETRMAFRAGGYGFSFPYTKPYMMKGDVRKVQYSLPYTDVIKKPGEEGYYTRENLEKYIGKSVRREGYGVGKIIGVCMEANGNLWFNTDSAGGPWVPGITLHDNSKYLKEEALFIEEEFNTHVNKVIANNWMKHAQKIIEDCYEAIEPEPCILINTQKTNKKEVQTTQLQKPILIEQPKKKKSLF